MRILFVSIIIFALIIFNPAHSLANQPVFVIGQDIKSINDYMDSTKKEKAPDGFMVYAAINDLRGLWEPVDQGAGVNYADKLIKEYPQMKVIQIGLYMRYMLNEIVQGTFDKSIDQLGDWIKRTGKDVYLRIGYEFDNPENEYDPEQYKKAYRYIVDRLRKDGIHNVHFVWHSIAWKDTDWPAYDPMKWYPGDGYVDWVGISFFDIKRDDERVAAAALAQKINKPLMIAESSPFFQYTDEGKLQWIKELFEYINTNHVHFLSYIDVNWDGLPMFADKKWGDARFQNDPVLKKEWLKEIKVFKQTT